MITDIKGLHHVTSMASDAMQNNAFFTRALGLRRIKKTVNFDAPEVYHLYYGDEVGSPGSVMTHFPFPGMARGRPGAGTVGRTEFSVPPESLEFWKERLPKVGAGALSEGMSFGAPFLAFESPDGECFALVEDGRTHRKPWAGTDIPEGARIHGFRGARFHLQDTGATGELLEFMGYQKAEHQGDTTRYLVEGGNAADVIDLVQMPEAPVAQQGAGTVHHIAFAVEDRAAQLRVRQALMQTGYQVTPVIDRNYFWAIYFRSPGGVLFEVSTHEPGFDHDEDLNNLGAALKLPPQHEPRRTELERHLPPLID